MRVNRVDPLDITYLRIRGMWGIENPLKVFNYIYTRNTDKQFNFMCLINQLKYDSFNNRKNLELYSQNSDDLNIFDVEIKTPDNPALLRKAKLITLSR